MATLALSGCGPSKSADDGAAPFTEANGLYSVPANSPLRSHLAIQTVEAAGGRDMLELPAVVEADPTRVINILAPLSGRVVALKVGLGDHVRKGQVLAVLASGDMAQAQADEAKARDAADLASKALTRAKGVREAGGAADKDLEAAQSASNQARTELTRARDRLAALGGGARGGHGLALTAPETGVVTALSIAVGAQVSDPTATLMTIANADRVFVTASAPQGDVGKITAGAPADVVLANEPGQVWHGRIAQVNPLLEPDTRRQKARIVLDNPGGRLAPNMFATVRVAAAGAGGGVSVPQSALLMNNDTVSVLVEVRPWVFQRRAIRIADETDQTARVVSGLAGGERIVVRGGVLLND